MCTCKRANQIIERKRAQARKKFFLIGINRPSRPLLPFIFLSTIGNLLTSLSFSINPLCCIAQWHFNLLLRSRNPLGLSSQAPPHLQSSPKTSFAPLPAQKQASPRSTLSEPPTRSSSSPLPPPTRRPRVCPSTSLVSGPRILRPVTKTTNNPLWSSHLLRGSYT